MLKRIAVLIIIASIYSIVPVAAQQQDLLQLVEQYYNNTHYLSGLNLTEIALKENATDLNESLMKSEESIKNINKNIDVLNSEINTLEMNIQEVNNKKNETERKIRILNVLNNKESKFLLGTSAGMIAGLWIVSLSLVLLWRK